MTAGQFPDINAPPLAGCLTDPLVDRQALTASALICCPADFPGFAGHFPEAPVLPAVLQLLAVRLLAELLVGATLAPVSVERLKFKGMVLPLETVNIRVSLREQDTLCKCEFHLERGGAAIASGSLVFRRGDGGL